MNPSATEENGHDIIVIGGSAGAIEALLCIVKELPAKLTAAVFVVVHTTSESPRVLASILGREARVPVLYAEDGNKIKAGNIYVAPPDFHLLLEMGTMRVIRGPKENRHRPAIDPLLRSAAVIYGPRAVGIILSGMLDDGSAGLAAIKACGGIAVVQDPKDALFPIMPQSALDVAGPEHVVPASGLAALIVELSKTSAGKAGALNDSLRRENEMSTSAKSDEQQVTRLGKLSTFTCPECHGSLWELDDQKILRFRCHIGHAYSVGTLASSHAREVEEALAVALRSLTESITLSLRIADQAHRKGNEMTERMFRHRAKVSQRHAEIIATAIQTWDVTGMPVEETTGQSNRKRPNAA